MCAGALGAQVPSVLTSPQHYIFHYLRDGVLLLCCSQV